MDKKIIVSFSGGRTSAFLLKYLWEKHNGNILAIFANTGKEKEETLKFVNDCSKNWNIPITWIEAEVIFEKNVGTSFKEVNYETASRNGEPFENIIKKYGIPNMSFSHCSRELKIIPINKYLKKNNINDYYMAIGIRYDERHRINRDRKNYIYPLADEIKVDSNFIRNWWDKQPFNLNLKDYEGNCDLCHKKSKRKILTILSENPKIAEWWSQMEIKYGKDGFTFYRGKKSAIDMLNESKTNFVKYQDKHLINKTQQKLFDMDLDYETDCICKTT